MTDREALSIPNPITNVSSLCDECHSNSWKYRCPGCFLKSCSLPCVKSHKARTSCSGKRNRTEFVHLSQFDDNLLISDYNLLEETKRAAESARRMAGAIDGFRGYIGFRLPKSLLMLRNAANRRGTKLLLLPPGMSKRQTNQSRYDHRKNSIFWTIEWRFHATDVVLVNHDVDEHVSLFSVIEKHLAPSPLKNQLSPYCNVKLDDLKFFLRKTPKGPKSPFHELNIKAPIGRQLAGVVILEYPVVFVFLPSHSYEFEVEKDARLSTKQAEPPGSSDAKLSPKGNLFMEEEIEDDEVFSDTRVTDLMGHMNSIRSASIQQDYPIAEKAVHVSNVQIPREAANGLKPHSSQKRASIMQEAKRNCISNPTLQDYDMQISRTVTGSSNPFSSQKPQASLVEKDETFSSCPVNSSKPSGEANFDFQQELRDAYSDLIGGINPDDFLCLDGGYNDLDNLEMFCGEEELEEGEIPSH